jgi:hypothetical protein
MGWDFFQHEVVPPVLKPAMFCLFGIVMLGSGFLWVRLMMMSFTKEKPEAKKIETKEE